MPERATKTMPGGPWKQQMHESGIDSTAKIHSEIAMSEGRRKTPYLGTLNIVRVLFKEAELGSVRGLGALLVDASVHEFAQRLCRRTVRHV